MISSLDVKDKENAVRLLELEVHELELNDRITQLKAEQLTDGLESIIKKQNQILLHIEAEIKFIKQRPCDLVLINSSIENISRIIKGQTEPIIDEGCVGCCKVVDVAAKLQTELDEYKKINGDQSRTIHYLKQEIVGRKDQLMEQREATESKEREVLRLKDKFVEHTDTIEELKDRNSEDLHELYTIDKEEIDRLKAELSTRNHDSEVLKKVVEPEDTSIDENQDITVTFAFLELP